MICSNCGTENRVGRKFCLKCGTALATGCPNCGAENEPEAAFCGNCGRSLGAAATEPPPTPQMASPFTQRRLVTVMFADLVGFTPFAEERDAEDVRDTLERYGAMAREVVERYGGTVEKFIGDAVMAVWGTPTAHEDDAERAVRAALELADSVGSLGAHIEARGGVLTGEAAVNVGATDQALLAGDLVNTAARLQSVAPAGTVLVGESTMRATSASVAYEPAGDQVLKGKALPVPAWQAMRVIAQRRGAGRSESVETPFVGRDEEFRLLREQLLLTGRDPRVRLVSVTGPAGIGKSRIAWELEKYIDGIVDTIYWHRGRCPSYGEGVSFWALGEMVRRRARLAETDDEATTRQRVRSTVEEYVGEAGERDWIEQSLLVLLGVEQQPEAGRDTLFAAWRRFFENVAARGTTVLVFEDLHWADAGLLDFIDHVLDWSRNVPLLIVTLARPELFERRPDWGAGRRTFTALALDPLPAAAMRQMLQALVPDLPSSALAAIVARADGIPLYAVETVRMLLADGRLVEADSGGYRTTGPLGDLDVPDSLRSLITSRLDGLDAADRRVIQDASVLGQTFTLEALAAQMGETVAPLETRLRQLVRRELLTLQQDPRSPERGQFGFTQSLVREVAYSTLARPQRRERHLTAARNLEARGGDELAGVLAGHYLAAYEASAAGAEADAVAAQARVALRGAAERAASLGGHKQAAEFLQQALAVTPMPSERAQLLERHAQEIEFTGGHDEAQASLRSAIELYRQMGDAAGVGRSRTILGQALVLGGREADAVTELMAALAELPADVAPEIRADMLAKLSRAQYRANDWQGAIPTADEALNIAERHRFLRIAADAMVSKGSALQIGLRGIEALALMRGGYELARRLGDTSTELRALANLELGVAAEEGWPEAQKIIPAAMEIARRIGDLPQVIWHTNNAVFAAIWSGSSIAEAIAPVEELMATDLADADRGALLRGYTTALGLTGGDFEAALTEYRGLVSKENLPGIDLYSYFPWMARGDFANAAKAAERAADERPDLGTMPAAVFAAVAARDLDEARRLLSRTEELPVLGRVGEADLRAARSALAALDGRLAEAMPELRLAMAEYEALQPLNQALFAIALLRAVGTEVPEAREYGEQARRVFERMGAKPFVSLMEQLLAEAPPRGRPDSIPQPARQSVALG